MDIKKVNFEDILNLRSLLPGANNYLDLKLMDSKDEILSSHFFILNDSGFLSISSTGSLNIYAKDNEVREKLLDEAFKQVEKPSLLLGDNELNEILPSSLPVKKYNPYFYLSYKPFEKAEIESTLTFHSHLTLSDQALVDQWYQKFNQLEDASWDTPQIEELGKKKLFLGFKEGELACACANTLVNDERFWIGRLLVFPEFRRRGFGVDLMRVIENCAFEENQSVDMLVNCSNERALDFYDKLGAKNISTNAYWVFDF